MIINPNPIFNRRNVILIRDLINKRATNKVVDKLTKYENKVLDQTVFDYYDTYESYDEEYDEEFDIGNYRPKQKNKKNTVFNTKTDAVLFLALVSINHERINRTYTSIANDKRTSNGNILRMKVKNLSNNQIQRISNKQLETIKNNQQFILKQLKHGELDFDRYKSFIKLYPKASRVNLLDRTLKDGLQTLKEGTSFKELENMTKGMYRQASRESEYEKVVEINNERTSNGLDVKFNFKRWEWSQLEKTRHESMDGVVVPIDEPFEVVNEVNGDVDYLMYPLDFTNDSNNCSNICNCQCDVSYTSEV